MNASAKVELFKTWIDEVNYCTRKLRAYEEDGTNVDALTFLNLNLSNGTDKQYSEMKKMYSSFTEKELDELGDYSLLQLMDEVNKLEEAARLPKLAIG